MGGSAAVGGAVANKAMEKGKEIFDDIRGKGHEKGESREKKEGEGQGGEKKRKRKRWGKWKIAVVLAVGAVGMVVLVGLAVWWRRGRAERRRRRGLEELKMTMLASPEYV